MFKQDPTKKPSLSGMLIGLGAALLLSAVSLSGYNQWLDARAGQEIHATVTTLMEEMPHGAEIIRHIPAPEAMLSAHDEPAPQTAESAGTSSASYMGILSIPKLERLLPVQDGWSLSKLKHSPCRYSGSIRDGRLVIAAHNYKAHFGGLSTLSQGDSVVFTAPDGSQTFYKVAEICTVEATDTDGMVNSGYDLTLFTCNYGGSARVAVRCTRCRPDPS